MSNDIDKTRLIDREFEVGAVPSVDACLVEVYYGYLDVGTFDSNDSTGGTACERAWSMQGDEFAFTHQRSQHQLSVTMEAKSVEQNASKNDIDDLLQQIFVIFRTIL